MKKKTKIEFFGKVDKDGLLIPYQLPVGDMIKSFFLENPEKDFRATYKIINDVKSYAQLRFYFGVLLPAFISTTGETDKNKIDHYLREKYLARWEELKLKNVTRKALHIPTLGIDANEIDRVEMSSFISNCMNELFDLGGSIDQVEIDTLYSVTQEDIEGQQLFFTGEKNE